MGAIRVALAALAVAILGASAPALAANEVFEHRGWKGYVVRDEPGGGCRMSKRAGSLHAVVHITNDPEIGESEFRMGFVSPRSSFVGDQPFEGFVEFDGRKYFPLNGRSDNSQLVTFSAGDWLDNEQLESAFRGSRRMVLRANHYLPDHTGFWIDMPLGGSSRATDLLARCAVANADYPRTVDRRAISPPVTTYAPAPSTYAPAPSTTGLRPPSFDCRYAGRAAEFAVCANPLLGHLDAEMADIHGIARARSRRRAAFDRDQTRWRDGRDACGANATCIERSYRRRINELSVLAGFY